jgi:hypothetical protein
LADKSETRYDLLGDPIPENWGGKGRPAHIPREENRNRIRLLLAFGWTKKRIAQALRITLPTLRKHYSSDLRARDEARPALEAQRLQMVYDQARAGNVGAIKELGRLIERDELHRALPRPATDEAPDKLGKKERAARDAIDGHEGTGWDSLLTTH